MLPRQYLEKSRHRGISQIGRPVNCVMSKQVAVMVCVALRLKFVLNCIAGIKWVIFTEVFFAVLVSSDCVLHKSPCQHASGQGSFRDRQSSSERLMS